MAQGDNPLKPNVGLSEAPGTISPDLLLSEDA